MAVFIVFLSISSKGIAQVSYATVKDIDGNEYKTVKIGTQVWMTENLKTTKYNNGTLIPNVTDTQWKNLTTAEYCWHKNDAVAYKNPYGALYNWYVVETSKLCPKGWHVSSDKEWTTLMDYLGGYDVAGGKVKDADTTYWRSPNKGATNESGFSALPGGWCEDGEFGYLRGAGWCWTSTYEPGPALIQLKKDEQAGPWMRVIFDSQISIKNNNSFHKGFGISVRCLKDN